MFPAHIIPSLGYYVYVYVDPDTDEVFYVGKGKANRAFQHLDEDGESEKLARIRAIRALGREPRIEILVHGIDTEPEAYRVECAVIDLLGVKKLTNRVRGHHSKFKGRMTVEQVMAAYNREPADVVDPLILIRVNRLFRPGASAQELYDATRGHWKVGHRRLGAKLALSVFEGIVQETYNITAWFPSGSTLSTRGTAPIEGRYEFVGNICEPSVRARYQFKAVDAYFARGNQNPITYVNVPGDSGAREDDES